MLSAASAHLQGSSSEVNARARDGLRLEANEHVRPEAVVHVIPKKQSSRGWISSLLFF